MSCDGTPQYALVTYVRSELGEFVEGLRRELHPAHAHLPTHLTVLPPRPLHNGTEQDAIEMLRHMATKVAPFYVDLDMVESFLPTTPTVFIRVSWAGYRIRELHDLLNRVPLAYDEPLPYMPHVTVAKLDNNERAAEVLRTSRVRWERYRGSHRINVERLTFVRGSAHTWTDLAEVRLSAAGPLLGHAPAPKP
jgi:2'-5' RNA ligase